LDLLRSPALVTRSDESDFSLRGSQLPSIRSQAAGTGWFSATSQNSCGNGDAIQSSGLATGQRKVQFVFYFLLSLSLLGISLLQVVNKRFSPKVVSTKGSVQSLH
jgi:hypothetical protein